MGFLESAMQVMKAQTGSRYRLVRLDPANVTEKKIRGYEFVRKEDPEVKGTILEQQAGPDGIIKLGNQGLARIPEKAAQERERVIHERTDRRLQLIKRQYLESGEDVKRKLGTRHKEYDHFVEEEK